jgi:hypothetical protein
MDFLTKQYNYLKSCNNASGQLVDKKLKAPLNFQYHYSSFILSSILKKDYDHLKGTLDYFFSIPKKTIKPSNDFNIVLLSFSILNDEDNMLDNYKKRIINFIDHNTNKELFKLNNNFRALRFLGMLLESKIKNQEINQEIYTEIEWILDLQFDDGFFPDSNIEYKIKKNQGVPHLAYHTKIMMCVGFGYLYTKDKRLKYSFLKAMEVLLNISTDNYFFFYGRSTNSLFGYGTIYVAFILAYKLSNNKIFLSKANAIKNLLELNQHSDGHISINLNKDDSKRSGFDGYMYDVVYNAYSNALFLLGDTIFNKILDIEDEVIKVSDRNILIYRNSGFLVYKKENIKFCINFKGHQNSLKHRFDSRVSPFSLLYYQKDKKNLLPAVGHKPCGISSLVEKKFFLQKLYLKFYNLCHYNWLPIFSGNSFFFEKNGIKFYPYRCIKFLRLNDTIILKFESKSRSIFNKINKFENFVLSIDLREDLTYKFFFYDQVDTLFYTYREISGKNNFEYLFSKKYKKLSNLKVETSYQMADLHRLKFENIKKLEIKVKIND